MVDQTSNRLPPLHGHPESTHDELRPKMALHPTMRLEYSSRMKAR